MIEFEFPKISLCAPGGQGLEELSVLQGWVPGFLSVPLEGQGGWKENCNTGMGSAGRTRAPAQAAILGNNWHNSWEKKNSSKGVVRARWELSWEKLQEEKARKKLELLEQEKRIGTAKVDRSCFSAATP